MPYREREAQPVSPGKSQVDKCNAEGFDNLYFDECELIKDKLNGIRAKSQDLKSTLDLIRRIRAEKP